MNLSEFFDTRYAEFSPYDEIEGNKWSYSPLTTVGHFDMNGWLNLDDGSVVCSEFAPDHWIFSTLWTPDDQDHPVSGNREFGFFVPENPSGGDPYYVFYTRGADRPTGLLDYAVSNTIFAAAHSLWTSFQVKLTLFIDKNGGEANLRHPYSCRYDWDTVRASYHNPTPTTPWLD
ncbi:MAG: hypothetical protein AVDCRST_MAG93-8906 [uncultured Chloroflexia bacterium]|uniref:Uncharacterized protein n=1 Tax=uncultured Chloroflexia bacterium TaxID=1672391 RepID=A0A6J4N3X2_9CHLR|nr:MAG: hypothetical protein AVDCRST_MAG93-8906 [uncultured Chloroflexia bacterium]